MPARLRVPRTHEVRPRTRSAFPGAIVFAFDDAKESTQQAYSVMQPAGIPAILPVNAAKVGIDDHCDWDEIATMAAGGWEVVNHGNTHADMTLLSGAALTAEITDGRATLLAKGYESAAHHFVVPFHSTNATVRAAIQDAGYKTNRDQSTSVVQLYPRPLASTALQFSSVLFTVTDIPAMTALMDTAVAQRGLCLIHTHGGDTVYWGQIRDHVVANGYLANCMTMSQAYDQLVWNGLLYDSTDY